MPKYKGATLAQHGIYTDIVSISDSPRIPSPYWFHPYPLHWYFLDHNIARLVNALNLLPGIRTMGSCGGHENPNHMQQPLGKWVVTLRVSLSSGGWHSLEMITNLQGTFGTDSISVNAHSHTHESVSGRGLWFAIRGDGSDPDEVASKLRRMLSHDRQRRG